MNKNNIKFKKIETYSNWGHWDRVDGKDLKTGDVLLVLWPDKTVTVQKVFVVHTKETVDDMGHPWVCPDCAAYIKVSLRGEKIKVALRGSSLKVTRKLNTTNTCRICNGYADGGVCLNCGELEGDCECSSN